MSNILAQLDRTLEKRRGADPDASYTASLFTAGTEAILKKIGEEATEVIIAGKAGDAHAIVHETADLWFHTLVLLSHCGLSSKDVLGELKKRSGKSGLIEKASRNRRL
jgi:phosphoribosyl-ATP pyrophosphohydrolase